MAGGVLDINPSTVEFGNVTDGTVATIDIVLSNTGDTDIVVDEPSIDNALFDCTIGGPITIAPGASVVRTVSFSPVAAGAQFANCTFSTDAINGPFNTFLTGTGVASGTKQLSADPSSWDFGDGLTGGAAGTEKIFTLTNTGTVNVTVTALGITVGADFELSTDPTDPNPVVIAAGGTVDFGVKFKPITTGLIKQTASIASDAVGTPLVVNLTGTGVPIVVAYAVDGVEGVLAAFADAGAVVVKQFDPDDQSCEETASLARVHNWESPGIEKYVAQYTFKYEDLGVATVQTYVGVSGVTLTIGTVGADGLVKEVFALYTEEGEYISTSIVLNPDAGPLSLLEYRIKVDDWNSVVGTLSNPTTITSAFIVSGDEVAIAAFSDLTVKQFDPEDQDCEEPCTFEMLFNMNVPFFEKFLAKIQLNYEDLSNTPTELTVRASNRRGQETSEVVTLVGAGDNDVKFVTADVMTTEELILVRVERAAGVVSLTGYGLWFEIKGEVIQGT